MLRNFFSFHFIILLYPGIVRRKFQGGNIIFIKKKTGANFGLPILDAVGQKNPIARGVAMGMPFFERKRKEKKKKKKNGIPMATHGYAIFLTIIINEIN